MPPPSLPLPFHRLMKIAIDVITNSYIHHHFALGHHRALQEVANVSLLQHARAGNGKICAGHSFPPSTHTPAYTHHSCIFLWIAWFIFIFISLFLISLSLLLNHQGHGDLQLSAHILWGVYSHANKHAPAKMPLLQPAVRSEGLS